MSIRASLSERNQGVCELCNTSPSTQGYLVSPKEDELIENQVALCDTCVSKLTDTEDAEYWRCLEGSIWNPEPSVQALSYRILHGFRQQEWANEVLNSVELNEEVVQWAMSAHEVAIGHVDSFGNKLETGDTVVLTQALNVKGTSFSAPKGTIVKRIRLVPDNTEQIEGKINEQTIVILTKYVKKG
jgi:protein PhnA